MISKFLQTPSIQPQIKSFSLPLDFFSGSSSEQFLNQSTISEFNPFDGFVGKGEKKSVIFFFQIVQIIGSFLEVVLWCEKSEKNYFQ